MLEVTGRGRRSEFSDGMTITNIGQGLPSGRDLDTRPAGSSVAKRHGTQCRRPGGQVRWMYNYVHAQGLPRQPVRSKA